MNFSATPSFASLYAQRLQTVPVSPELPLPPGSNIPGSDIVLHLPVLEYYASLCDLVVELGVRDGHSTVALCAGARVAVHSCDLVVSPFVRQFMQVRDKPCSWFFHRASSISPQLVLPECDLVFFDTLHTYEHLRQELARHAQHCRKFLVFHDTATCGQQDRSGPDPEARGILPAIEEFRQDHPEWSCIYRTNHNNGLLILSKG